jgi:hypothetical protein
LIRIPKSLHNPKYKSEREAFAMRLKLAQRSSDYPPRIPHPDLSSVDNSVDTAESIADSITLLRDENDRLRKMAAMLSGEADSIRQSLSPAQSTALLV